MSTIFHMDAASLFVGDEENGHHLDLANVKPAALEEMEEDFIGAGAGMQVGIPMAAINKLMVPFQIKGLAPDLQKHFMGATRKRFTIRGNVFNLRTEEDMAARISIQGKMRKAETSQFEKSSGVNTDFEIGNIFVYEMYVGEGTSPLYAFDYFAGIGSIVIDGQRPYAGKARNLGLV